MAGDATQVMYENVGLLLGATAEATAYMYENGDNAALPIPPGALFDVTPNYGAEGASVTIRGYGLGTTEAARSSVVRLNGVTMSVTSWTVVPAAGSPEINEQDGTLTIEHESIVVDVPVGGESGQVFVDSDDGVV